MPTPDLAMDDEEVEEAAADTEKSDHSERDDQPDAELEEPDILEVDLTDEDFDGGLFTGVEDSSGNVESPTESHPLAGEKADNALGLSDGSSEIETAINEGAARLAVVGLDTDFKLPSDEDLSESDCLEAEFYEVFRTFRLGYFGAAFLDEYIFTDDDQVDPAWGLLGAMLCATAITIWMRPDGEEIVADFASALGGIGGGL